jgi:Ca2+-binding RTX toxin-like protein
MDPDWAVELHIMEGETVQITSEKMGDRSLLITEAHFLLDGVAKWWFDGPWLYVRAKETTADQVTNGWVDNEDRGNNGAPVQVQVNVFVEAWESANNVTGHSYKDKFLLDAGDDTATGLGSNDIINGGAGNDAINGGTGDDRLTGGEGEDTIMGSKGRDIFFFDEQSGVDTTDFNFDQDTAKFGDHLLTSVEERDLFTLVDSKYVFDAAAAIEYFAP